MKTTYRRLTFTEWEEISRGIWTYEKFAAIARRLGRPTSAVSREVWNNTKYRWCYRAEKAQEKSQRIRHSGGRKKKIEASARLKNYIYAHLRGEWSPEEIANRIKRDYPQDKTMRISHETIYQHLYCLPRGQLKAELMKGLRQERK